MNGETPAAPAAPGTPAAPAAPGAAAATAATAPARSTANVETVLFGLLLSLTLKIALDTAYGTSLVSATSEAQMLRVLNVPRSALLLVFLFTLMRFVYGSYRINDEVQTSTAEEGALPRFWNLIATLVLFVLFYAAGLSIRHAGPFFISLLAIHVWDLLWLVSMALFSKVPGLKKVMRRFVYIDVLTIIALAASIWLTDSLHRNVAISLMFALGLADFVWNSDFFFRPALWRERSAGAR
ncbi:MAG TPA: hypothetical protein VM864_01035 [Pyrinomonadaceae bacterium]|jgi:hypothetical protein|nr:hypothetical protein [Pyrinomonadaceae bacterium]